MFLGFFLPHTLRHVQRSQHLLKNGPLHIGAPQVGFLKVTSWEVTVLGKTNNSGMHHRFVDRAWQVCTSPCVRTSRSVPASVAPLRLQFFSLAFFSVATLRLIPVIWLPSMSTPLRLAPTITHTHFNMSFATNTPLKAALKKKIRCFTLQIGFNSSRVFKITTSQRGSFCIGAQHLHTLQVGCLRDEWEKYITVILL